MKSFERQKRRTLILIGIFLSILAVYAVASLDRELGFIILGIMVILLIFEIAYKRAEKDIIKDYKSL